MERTIVFNENRELEKIILECSYAEYAIIDRGLNMFAEDTSNPDEERKMAKKMRLNQLETQTCGDCEWCSVRDHNVHVCFIVPFGRTVNSNDPPCEYFKEREVKDD